MSGCEENGLIYAQSKDHILTYIYRKRNGLQLLLEVHNMFGFTYSKCGDKAETQMVSN